MLDPLRQRFPSIYHLKSTIHHLKKRYYSKVVKNYIHYRLCEILLDFYPDFDSILILYSKL